MKKMFMIILAITISTSTTMAFALPKQPLKKTSVKTKITKSVKKVVKPVPKSTKKVSAPIIKVPDGKGIGINPGAGTGIKGITTNKMPYEIITDLNTLPEDYNSIITSLRENKGYFFTGGEKAGYTFTVFSGQKNTGGYGIKVVSVEDVEGITTITVAETSPEKGQLVNMMVTYPMVTLTMKHVNERIKVVDASGNEFNLLSAK